MKPTTYFFIILLTGILTAFFVRVAHAANPFTYTYGFSLPYTVACPEGSDWDNGTCVSRVPPTPRIDYFQPPFNYCVADNTVRPRFTWGSTNTTTCQITRSGQTQSSVGTSAMAGGGTLEGDGLYYKTINLPVIGSSSTYVLECSNGSESATAQTVVSLCAAADPGSFTLIGSPSSKRLTGTSVTYTVTATPTNEFTGNIDLSARDGAPSLPEGTVFSFEPTSITCSSGNCGTSTLTVTIPTAITRGPFPVMISGQSGATNRSTTVNVTGRRGPFYIEW